MIRRLGLLALALLLPCLACVAGPRQDIKLAWTPVTELNDSLPPGVRVHSGVDPSIPLRAWTVRIRPARDVVTRVAVSTDADGRETVSDFARRTGARVAVNAGYFRMDLDPAVHIGLLLVDRILVEPALTSVIRNQQRYYLARAALGLHEDGSPDVAWVSSRQGILYEWSDPPHNAPEVTGEPPVLEALPVWPVVDAVAAGPALIIDGEVRITTDEEVFFGSAIPGVHPRTAAGVTARGELVLLVVDGRQRDSRGVDLLELATLMHHLGCTQALNLDGGGSSTLVVDGELINRPVGGTLERQVMSALTVLTR